MCVQNLHEEYVGDKEEVLSLITEAERYRAISETILNKSSSRSHLLLILDITQKLPDGIEKRGTLNLVDLAGSEKISKSKLVGETLEEARKINLSLSTLGNVISALTTLNREHIPYRDSKLTRLLKDSLGGNYKTTLIVTCSPHAYHYEESISTLKFAQRAKKIKNKARINIKHSNEKLESMLSNLAKELKQAKEEISRLRGNSGTNETMTTYTPKLIGSPDLILLTEENIHRASLISQNDVVETNLKDEEIKVLRKEIETLKEENDELKSKVEALSKEQNLDDYITKLRNSVIKNIEDITELKQNSESKCDENLRQENQRLKEMINELNKKYLDDIKKIKTFDDIINVDNVEIDFLNKAIKEINDSHNSDFYTKFNFPNVESKDKFLLKLNEDELEGMSEAYKDIFEYNQSFLHKILNDFSKRDYFKTFKVNLNESLAKVSSEIHQRNKTNKLKNSFIHFSLVTMFYEKLLHDVLNKVLLDNKKWKLIDNSNKAILDKMEGFNSLFENYMDLLGEFKTLKAESSSYKKENSSHPLKANIVRPVSKRYTVLKRPFIDRNDYKVDLNNNSEEDIKELTPDTKQDIINTHPLEVSEVESEKPKFDCEQIKRLSMHARISNRKKSTGGAEVNDDVLKNLVNRQNTGVDSTPELKYVISELKLYKNFLNILMNENKILKQKEADTNEIVRNFQENYRNIYEQEITNYSNIVEVLKVFLLNFRNYLMKNCRIEK
jgi:kinesin family protein 5